MEIQIIYLQITWRGFVISQRWIDYFIAKIFQEQASQMIQSAQLIRFRLIPYVKYPNKQIIKINNLKNNPINKY